MKPLLPRLKNVLLLRKYATACSWLRFAFNSVTNDQSYQWKENMPSLHQCLLSSGKWNNWTSVQGSVERCPRFVVWVKFVRDTIALHNLGCTECHQRPTVTTSWLKSIQKLEMSYGSIYGTYYIIFISTSPVDEDKLHVQALNRENVNKLVDVGKLPESLKPFHKEVSTRNEQARTHVQQNHIAQKNCYRLI